MSDTDFDTVHAALVYTGYGSFPDARHALARIKTEHKQLREVLRGLLRIFKEMDDRPDIDDWLNDKELYERLVSNVITIAAVLGQEELQAIFKEQT